MQVRNADHTRKSTHLKDRFESVQRSYNEDIKLFYNLFEESTFEGSLAAARKMRKIAERQTKRNQKSLLFHSLRVLVLSDSEMLSWPSSPLLVMLQFVDPSVLSGREGAGSSVTSLHFLGELADPSDYSTHENQLILAKQLIERGANVNAVSSPQGLTPLHIACSGDNVTNLDFVQLLLNEGADPNAQDHLVMTPLMLTAPCAPGAAKFLLNWSTTDATITNRSGASFLAFVRMAITDIVDKVALPDNPNRVQHQFLLQHWREIEEMLGERGARDTGITAFD
jgi:hypothetical protein